MVANTNLDPSVHGIEPGPMANAIDRLAAKVGLGDDEELTRYDFASIALALVLEVQSRGWTDQKVAEMTRYDLASVIQVLDVTSGIGSDELARPIDTDLGRGDEVQAEVMSAIADVLRIDLVRSGRRLPALCLALADALARGDAPQGLVEELRTRRRWGAQDFRMLALGFTGWNAPARLTPRYNLASGLETTAEALLHGANFSARFALEGVVEDAEAGHFDALGPIRLRPSLARDHLMGDMAATATSRDWRPGDNTASLIVDVVLLGLPVPLHGEIGLDVARGVVPAAGDPRLLELVEVILGRLCRDRDVAMGMILRTGLGPLLYDRLSVTEQEELFGRLGAPDYEVLLEPLTTEFTGPQRRLWLDLQLRDRWWDDVGERIFLSVKAEPTGPLLALLEVLDR